MPNPATRLASWLRANTPPRPDALTHLKLQKLLFYCYGAATAHEHDGALGTIEFEAWEHGPVCRDVWKDLRTFNGKPLPPLADDAADVAYDDGTARLLHDVVNVYGRLDAWSLRQESHLEAPWIDAWGAHKGVIADAAIRAHFTQKFGGAVSYPEYLLRRSSMELDGIAVRKYPSLRALSRHVSAMLGPTA